MKKELNVIIVETKILKGKLNTETGEIEIYDNYKKGLEYSKYGVIPDIYGTIVDEELEGESLEVKSQGNYYYDSNFKEMYSVEEK